MIIYPAFLILLLELVTIVVITKFFGEVSSEKKYNSIDGFRGFLASFVFLHHSCIWFFYMKTGSWANPQPPSNFYVHLGQDSVCFFFMITSFLFFNKLLDEGGGVNFKNIFISRFYRITPLYLIAILCVFIIALAESKWNLNVSIWILILSYIKYILFGFFGLPNINELNNTIVIYAGVFWTLAYEWSFYLLLPLIAFALNWKINKYLVLSTVPVFWVVYFSVIFSSSINYNCLISFVSGMLCAVLSRNIVLQSILKSNIASFLCILIAIANMRYFSTAYDLKSQLLLFVIFLIVSCGNDFYGLLISKYIKSLGAISFGIYLLHGILLFLTIKYIVGSNLAYSLSFKDFWILVGLLAPVVITLSYISYKFVEQPFIRKGRDLIN